MAYPGNLKYTKEHEWTRVSGTTATIGITSFAKDQLGDVVYLELPEAGAQVKKGQPFGVVESTKAVSELFSPVTGKITRVNKDLVSAPEGINDDPYEKGWLIEVQVASASEFEGLLDAAAYQQLVESEQK